MDDREITVRATRNQIEDIKESLFWKDLEIELGAWKKGFEIEMGLIVQEAETENSSTASVLLHMGDINGRSKAVDYLLSIPDIFLQILEEQKDDNRRDQA